MKIPWIFGGFLFLVIQLSVAKLDENILGAQGSELLKELKESGVLDSFEQELEKMLHQEKIKNEEGDDTNEIKVNIQFHEFFDSFNFFFAIHAVFFISIIYKQHFFQLVKFPKKISNKLVFWPEKKQHL